MKNILTKILRKVLFLYFSKIERYYILYRSEYYTKKTLSSCKSGLAIKVNGKIVVTHPNSTVIGNNVHIGNNCFFYSSGGLIIGENTHISRNVTIYTASHNYNGRALPYDNTYIEKPVMIGENVWIGMNVTITPGVKIGNGAVIGIGTVVARDVHENEIVASQPIRVLKSRDGDTYKKNLSQNNIGGVNGKLLDKRLLKTFRKKGQEIQNKLFFIVSTGRSGSTSIANILNQNPEIECKHEYHGQLVRLSTEYAHQIKSKEDVLLELHTIYNTAGFLPPDKFYGESDQKAGNLIEFYHQLFPSAKFLWLIRHPLDNVVSMYSRGWFSDNEFGIERRLDTPDVYSAKVFSQYRLNGFKAGEFSEHEWNTMHPFERNCWYWYFWNKKIQTQLQNVNESYWKILSLDKIEQKIGTITDFIGSSKFNYKVEVSNRAKYELINKKNLSPEFNQYLEKWCLPYWTKLRKKYAL